MRAILKGISRGKSPNFTFTPLSYAVNTNAERSRPCRQPSPQPMDIPADTLIDILFAN